MPVILAALLLLPAQAGGVVSGIVRDGLGAPVPGAVVRLESGGRTLHELQTGSDGRFAFPETVTRAAQLIVTAPGFEIGRAHV